MHACMHVHVYVSIDEQINLNLPNLKVDQPTLLVIVRLKLEHQLITL